MNKVYRLIWNETTGAWVAVAEIARARGKPSRSGAARKRLRRLVIAPLAIAMASIGLAHAAPGATELPTGGKVVAGQAGISQSNATMDINQTSGRAAIDWRSFNIGSAAQVNFHQPDADSVTLNRVQGGNPSQIFGKLSANGQVFLTNPSGVHFAPGASVNVGGLVATTHSISVDDFMAGKATFERDGATGGVINEGDLQATLGGYIALLAPEVRNGGVIVAEMGTVALASGEAISLNFGENGSLAGITATKSRIAALVENRRAVIAPGGLIILSAQAVNQLRGGVVNNSGQLSANSLTSKGGRIYLAGGDVELAAGSTTEATGATGGGEVLVGGDWQGSGDMPQAIRVTMEQGASIDVSATDNGDGGKAVLWSDVSRADSLTAAHGTITARGGAKGGDGGRIETSGHTLDTTGVRGTAAASRGHAGQWLFDPYDYTITGSNVGTITTLLDGGTSVTIDTANPSSQGVSGTSSSAGDITVNAAITSTSTAGLTLNASGAVNVNQPITLGGSLSVRGYDITVNQPISHTGSTDGDLLLKATRHISLTSAANLTATTSKFNMLLWADSDNSGDGISVVSAHTIDTNGGTLQFGNDQTATINGQSVRVGGDVYFNGNGSAQTLSTGGGSVDVFGETIVSNAAGLTINSGDGNIRFHGLLNSGNQYTWVDKTSDTAHDWDWARADAKNGTAGGASLGDSYLVTITSRLENAIAGLTAGYRGAWIGAYRPGYSSGAWVWADGPERGKQFFTQTAGGSGGTTASGYYSNFGSGEPNGCMTASTCEGVGQFFGTAGQWNDLVRTTQFSASQANQYAVLGYVRETNLAPSPVTINAGSGTVTFDGNVGASKPLASVNVSGTGTATLPAVVTTKGTQTYNVPVELVQNTALTTTNSDIAFNSTVNSADAAQPKDLTINIVPDTAYYWVNWTSSDATHVYGTITVGGDVIGVTYTNNQGYAFVQTSGSITGYNYGGEVFTNYWSQTQDAHAYDGVTYVSPYVSASVANGPTTANLVALRYAGSQTLTFSQPVENLAFSIMSLNGNGYGFNQDFNIESYTGLNGAATGYYGTGTFSKTSSGNTYNLNGTSGEPHGTIRFANAFNQLTWNSLSNEYWNGFTVGVTGTSATAGKVRFNGVAGSSAGLGAVTVNGQMQTTANIVDAGSLSVSGLSDLGGNITTAGNQNYESAVTLSADATLTTTNNGSVSTTSTINGAHSLTVSTNGTGDITFGEAVGGTTALTGLSVTTDVLSAKAIALANSAALSVIDTGDSEISGVISGVATTLTKAGDGTLTLTGANTYTGATTIDAGTLRVLSDTASAANTTSGYSGSGGALLIEPVSASFSGAFAFNKPVSGSLSALTIGKPTNIADITLDGATSVAGPINVYGGTVTANASLSTTNATNGDVSIAASTGLSGSGNIALADGRTLTVDQAGSTIYNGAISGTGANFVKNGVGDLGLGGASTYGGSTTVNAGVLSLAAADRLPDTTALTVGASGTFSLNGFNETVGSISGNGLIVNGAVVRDGLVLWLDAGNAASYDGTGTAWHDLSGNGYDGTLVGAPTYNATTSLFSFTDNTQYVQLAALPANFLGGTVTGLTVFTVANFGPTADSWERVVDLGNTPSPINTPSNNIILARNGTTNRLAWEYYNGVNAGATYTSIGANTAITNNVKGSYVGTADGSNLRIYRDGVLNTTTASTALPNAIARSSNFIGKSNWAQDDTFRGDIGTLMVYNRALSAAEIAKNHQLLFNRSTATLTTGGNNADTTFSGKIENGVSTLNLVKQGSGTLTLSGSNGYTGSTTVGGGTLKIENDAPASATLTSGFVGSGGALAIVPSGTSFSSAYSFNLPMSGSFSGLLIGKTGNTAAIAMDEAVSIAGDIALIGGDLTLNQKVESTGSHTVTLSSSGNVTDGASGYLSADKLLLQGGNVTLDNASNAVNTLAASGVGNMSYVDSDALTLGTVGSTSGISASGVVSVATLSGDLTVAQDVATIDTSSAAIVLNAGKSAAAGTASGGNLVVSGSPAITTGTGGRATLYTGSVSGSTGMANLVGSGTGRFRYGSDEAASNFTLALGSGLYAIYREQPALTLTVADQIVTYGDALPTYTGTVTGGSIANGDSGYRLVGRVDSTGGRIKAGSYTIDAQGFIDLGYGVTQTTGTLTVNQLALAGSISAGSSVYGAALTAGTASFSNVLAGDLLGSASVAVATSGHTSISGHLQAGSYSGGQSVTALSGADAGNYSLSAVTGDYTVSQLALSVSGITASNKVYDGDATATVNTAAAVLGNLVSGDDVTISATGAFADKNVGTGKTVTLSSSYGGADLGNYTVTDQASTTADITARALTISGITAANKTYDGNAIAAVNTAASVLGNLVSGDDVTISATGAFADKNVGTGKTVTLTSSYGGADLGNYTVTDQASTTASIAARALAVSGITAANKVYDGNATAAVSTTGAVLGNLVSGDVVTVSAIGAFADKNVGTGKTVTLTSSYGGADLGNYTVTDQASTAADITARALAVSGITAANKTYDGNAIAAVNTTGAVLGNLVSGDDVTVSAIGAFADKNVGTGKTVTLSSSYGGADFGNYTVTGQASTAADVTARALVVSGITVANKVYDGNVTAAVSTAGAVLGNLVSGDDVTVSATGAFADKNVGTGKTVTLASSYGGADLGNYTVTDQASTPADITARALTISGITAANKTYDGNAIAAVNTAAAVLGNLVSGDDVTVSATGAFADKNVGTGKTVTLASSYGGADLGNYTVTDQASTAADITARALTISGITAANKVYDGNAIAAVNTAAAVLGNLVSGDDVTISATGAFADKNVGTGKTVTLASSYGGADLGNYTVTGQASTTADITPRILTVIGLAASGKTYDGTAGVDVTDWGHVDTGVGSETLALQASGAAFDDANAGIGKTVTASGYALSDGANGGVASNYRLSATSATTTADIAKAALSVTANDDAKLVTQADVSGYNGVQYSGFVHGEDASALGGSLTLSRINAGQNAAGTYRDVLVPAGLTGGNYDISYAAGAYTIVPAEQLLIRFDNASASYGAAPTYSLASVQYMDSGNAIRTLSGSQSGNTFTYSDGVGGSVSFTVAPQGAVTTGAGRLAVGNYALGDSAPTITGSNFSALLFTGNLAVTHKAVVPVVSGVSKVYDGTTGMDGATLAINGTLSGDAVSVTGSGAFARKNVGSGVNYTISNLDLSGADAANYYLSGGTSFSDNNGVITARPVTVSGIAAGSKTYDGNTAAALDMSGVQLANLVAGDKLTISATGAFADKNVGSGKTVTITSTYGGADLGNYVIASQDATTADIARLASVTWIGGASGNWFDPANWAGGAVPDLSNVANVIIPSGVVVSFDTAGAVSPAQTGPVNIDRLGNSGGLSQSNGELHVGAGGVTLDSYSQSGGVLTSVGPITLNSFAQTGGSTATHGNFNVNGEFSQGPNGTVEVGGNANITDTNGGTTLGNLTVAGNANVTSTDGDITQAGGTALTVAGTTTLNATKGGNPANIVLGNAGNDFGGPVNASGQHITLTDHAGGLTLGTINASGDFNATSTGGPIGQSGGGIVSVGGTTSLDASSAGQPANITLANGGNTFNGPINATGADILLNAAGGLTFGTVVSQGNVKVAALGDIGQTIGGSFTVSGSGIFQSLNGVIRLDSGNNTFGEGLQTLDTSNTDQTHVIVPVSQPVPLPAASDAAPLSASFPTSSGEGSGAAGSPLTQATASGAAGAEGGTPGASTEPAPAVGGPTAGTGAGVVVELRTAPAENRSGLITVSVPKGASGSPAGFSFPLPEQVVSTATPGTAITASLPDGAPLPAWLRFDPATRSFIASTIPANALPISVIVTVGNIQTTVLVTERKE